MKRNIDGISARMKLRCRSITILVIGAAVAAGVGAVIYSLYSMAEEADFERDYDLLAQGTISAAEKALSRMGDACAHTAAMYSATFPNATQWPNVALPLFALMINPMIATLEAKNINHIPLVRPEDLSSFEEFAYDFFAADAESRQVPNLGVSPFGPGVFAVNSTGHRFHDTTGETDFTDEDFVAPVFQVGQLATNAFVVMLNTHYEQNRGETINAVVDCFRENRESGASVAGCGALTDVLYLLQDSVPLPASIFYYPEYPVNDPDFLSGFVGVVFNWDSILAATVPALKRNDHFKLILELVSPTETVTYIANGGGSVEHRPQGVSRSGFSSDYRYTGKVDADAGTAGASSSFSLNVYPHDDMISDYFTGIPLITAAIAAASVFAAAMLLSYLDYFITSQVYEVELKSSLRRTFLRYVSHELRSPLNGVYMGIVELLSLDEVRGSPARSMSPKGSTLPPIVEEGPDSGLSTLPTVTTKNRPYTDSPTLTGASEVEGGRLVDLVNNIRRDTEMAMVVLDDLVTYVSLVDTKNTYKNAPVVCVRKVAAESIAAIKHLFTQYELTIVVTNTTTAGKGLHQVFPTMRGDSADLKMMFTYMLKLATKLCPRGEEISLHFSTDKALTKPSSSKQAATGTISASIQFVDNSCQVSTMSHLRRDRSDLSDFALDKLRTNTTSELVSSDLGHWIVYHIASRYNGIVDITNADGVTSISFEFPYAAGTCDVCAAALHRSSDEGNGMPCPHMEPTAKIKHRPSLKHNKVSCSPAEIPEGPEKESTERAPVLNSHNVSTESNGSVLTKVESTELQILEEDQLKLNILCVDDVPSNRKILSRLLTKKGHSCLLACDGQEAFDMIMINKVQVDAVCMDYEMPILDGPHASKALRDAGCKIPIIGVTGNVLPSDIEYFKSMGAQDVIGKPVNIGALGVALDRVVSEYRQETADLCTPKSLNRDLEMTGVNTETLSEEV